MQISVLKFGSSVLRSGADLPRVVDAVRAELRRGRRVVAVVSAFHGTTDRLLALADTRGFSRSPAATARLLATGENTAAAHFTTALESAGVPASSLDVASAGLRVTGPLLDADPDELDTAAVCARLEYAAVVVLPGFLGVDAFGRVALLGRGGSDLTAVFVAAQLDAATCRLVKDVDGLYTGDPATADAEVDRYTSITWEDLLALGGPVVQAKAVRFACDHAVSFEVGGLEGIPPTRVGSGPTRSGTFESSTWREPAA